MRISEMDFLRLLPVFMRDDEAVIALSKSMDWLIGAPSKRLKVIRVWDKIDKMTEAECDEMAWELDVDWYDHSYSLEVKRELIKNSLSVRRIAGTKAAVENVLASIFKDARVIEWFEYGGKPYFFRLEVGIPDEGINARQQDAAINGIKYHKNVRSRLESINYYTENEGEIKIGAYTSINELVEIWPELAENIDFTQRVSSKSALITNGQLEIWPELATEAEIVKNVGNSGAALVNQKIEVFP